LGAAAAAARLTNAPMLNALALSAGMAAGLKASFGSEAKPLNAGLAARAGIESAALAKSGLNADPKTIWGDQGFIALYGCATATPPTFGAPLAIEEFGLYVKKHPVCGYLSRLVEAALSIAYEPGFDPAQIKKVEAEAPARNAAVIAATSWGTPELARFCPHYCLATALAKGALGPSDFTQEALIDANIGALAARVVFRPSAQPQSGDDLSPNDPDHLVVHMTNGTRHNRTAAILTGGPDHPVSRVALFAKLEDCADASTDTSRLIRDLDNLRALPSLEGVTNSLASLFPKYSKTARAAGSESMP
ncbi:MAG: MmgE/PrpD family protein, partial [Pseudomonadota bacterium]